MNPTTSYQRLLVHRCSAYYRLAPESDPVSKGITVYSTTDSKVYVKSFLSQRLNPHPARGLIDPLGASQSLSRSKKPLNLLSKSCVAFNRTALNSNLPHNQALLLARTLIYQTWTRPKPGAREAGVTRLVAAVTIKST